MSIYDRNSFEGNEIDLTSVIAEFPEGDEMPGQMIPVRKLSEAFDNCAKGEDSCGKGEGNMKTYLRIKPIPTKFLLESTITVESGESFFAV